MKKVIGAILAGSLLLAGATPVFADSTGANGNPPCSVNNNNNNGNPGNNGGPGCVGN